MLVGSSLKIMNFMEYVRRRVKLPASTSLFLFINEKHIARTSIETSF